MLALHWLGGQGFSLPLIADLVTKGAYNEANCEDLSTLTLFNMNQVLI